MNYQREISLKEKNCFGDGNSKKHATRRETTWSEIKFFAAFQLLRRLVETKTTRTDRLHDCDCSINRALSSRHSLTNSFFSTDFRIVYIQECTFFSKMECNRFRKIRDSQVSLRLIHLLLHQTANDGFELKIN